MQVQSQTLIQYDIKRQNAVGKRRGLFSLDWIDLYSKTTSSCLPDGYFWTRGRESQSAAWRRLRCIVYNLPFHRFVLRMRAAVRRLVSACAGNMPGTGVQPTPPNDTVGGPGHCQSTLNGSDIEGSAWSRSWYNAL